MYSIALVGLPSSPPPLPFSNCHRLEHPSRHLLLLLLLAPADNDILPQPARQVMRSCMTLNEPDDPPRPSHQRGAGGQFTYGGDLLLPLPPRRGGADLCALVARCLQHLPADRPTLRQLRRQVAAGVAASPMTGADRRWMTDRLYGPGRPPPLYPVAPRAVVGAGGRISRRWLLRGAPLGSLS